MSGDLWVLIIIRVGLKIAIIIYDDWGHLPVSPEVTELVTEVPTEDSIAAPLYLSSCTLSGLPWLIALHQFLLLIL